MARTTGPVPLPQGGGLCFLLSSQKGRKKAGHHSSPVSLPTFLRCPFFEGTLTNRAGAGFWPQSAPLASVLDTACITAQSSCLGRPRPRGTTQATPPALLALTAKGLGGPPPQAGRGALLSEQGILPPLQGLLGLVA